MGTRTKTKKTNGHGGGAKAAIPKHLVALEPHLPCAACGGRGYLMESRKPTAEPNARPMPVPVDCACWVERRKRASAERTHT